jgi:chromosome partitioning protein
MKNIEKFDRHRAKRIAFVHHKGGTGKTTSCLNIAGWLNKLDQKVLVIDLDPQGNATAGLGVDVKSVTTSIADVLCGNNSIEDALLETDSGIYLIPATLDLLESETYLALQLNPTTLLRDKIVNLSKQFNYILFDAPPGSGLLMINSIIAAKNIIIPLDSGVFGFETLETLKIILQDIQQKHNIEITILMAILKNFSASFFDRGLTRNIKKLVEEFFAVNELEGCPVSAIPFSKKIYQAQYLGLPISHYAPKTRVGRAYRRIAKEIIGGNLHHDY